MAYDWRELKVEALDFKTLIELIPLAHLQTHEARLPGLDLDQLAAEGNLHIGHTYTLLTCPVLLLLSSGVNLNSSSFGMRIM